ncbi:Hypothetical predicted protein [Olea europaea subsp. europaea]|uniref:Uncharacterized protein n=1 Tax=Olea europaea subsp. europaea TaxID=158383 RepID=A0A8S0PHP8_OLEEU|nr:Hypothetical predicted protein [Olea europaea subsp. europaea]
MHGMETDVGKFGVVIIAGDDNEVQNRVGEAEVHRVETDVSKSEPDVGVDVDGGCEVDLIELESEIHDQQHFEFHPPDVEVELDVNLEPHVLVDSAGNKVDYGTPG